MTVHNCYFFLSSLLVDAIDSTDTTMDVGCDTKNTLHPHSLPDRAEETVPDAKSEITVLSKNEGNKLSLIPLHICFPPLPYCRKLTSDSIQVVLIKGHLINAKFVILNCMQI